MSIFVIGDIHGKIKQYEELVEHIHQENPASYTFQVGDMGVGFKGIPLPDISKDDVWISGNHDNHKACKKSPSYLGNFGFATFTGEEPVFYMRGAYSIDKHLRVEGISWWESEELTSNELDQAIAFYKLIKPKYVVTHDCPESVKNQLWPEFDGPITRTRQALQTMFDFHKPKAHFFGHYHQSKDVVIDGTNFVCLKELEYKKLC